MYARSREQAEAVAAELTREHGVEAAAFACDITDGAAVEQLVAAVTARFGRLDILVNDAAYNKAIPFPDLDGLTIERSEEHTSELQSLMRNSYAVFCLKKKQ